jgi:hypothetical protein
VLALELLLGRRLSPMDLKDRLPDLLDQWSDAATRAGLASERLRVWLERALQVGSRNYATAADAYADLRDMPSESAASAFDSLPMADVEPTGGSLRSLQPARRAAGQDSLMANATAPDDSPVMNTPQPARPFDGAQGKPALVPADRTSWDMFSPEVKPAPAPPRARESAPDPAALAPPANGPAATRKVTPPPAASTGAARRTTFKAPRVSPWIAAALGMVALTEGVVIAALLMRQPANATAATTVAPKVADSSPIADGASRPTTPPAATPAAPAVAEQRPAALTARFDPIQAAASKQKSGGIKFQTPIELKVLQGDKVFGSTDDGPIIAPEGTYQVDLVNTAYGVRIPRQVTFRAGQIASLSVTIPPGRLSVNAQPWAEVSIDNQPKGETPLANLSVPVGEHVIVFRHPELGEKRQTVIVRADQPARASITFER